MQVTESGASLGVFSTENLLASYERGKSDIKTTFIASSEFEALNILSAFLSFFRSGEVIACLTCNEVAGRQGGRPAAGKAGIGKGACI